MAHLVLAGLLIAYGAVSAMGLGLFSRTHKGDRMTTTLHRRPAQIQGTAVRAGQLDEDWRTQGVCRSIEHDPEAWYPHKPQDAWLGAALCKTCPVVQQCLNYAMAHDERHGTWGGLTEWQRDNLRRNRRSA